MSANRKISLHKFWYIVLCLAVASSCSSFEGGILDPKKENIIDPDLELRREDYRDLHSRRSTDGGTGGGAIEPQIPELADILVTPQPPKVGQEKLVSVAVTDDVPLKDVLIELARLADVDIEVDSGITGGIAFRAKDRPFNEVVARIADLAGLRYTMKDNVLRIERDTPYVQMYSLNLLNIDRSAVSSINVAINSGGGGGGGSGAGGSVNSGSSSAITGASKSDFWERFEASVQQILNYVPPQRTSDATVAAQPAPIIEPAGGGAGQPAPVPPPAAPAGGGGNNASSAGTSLVINRQAGTMTISANDRQHKMVQRFIDKIVANSSAQVLIEAKILEVTLDDEFRTGINWGKLGGGSIRMAGDSVNFPSVATVGTSSAPNVVYFPTRFGGGNAATDNVASFLFNKSIRNLDIEAAVKLLDRFGTTRTLSSPRLTATNNQQAVLSFAKNLPYFKITATVTPGTTGTSSGAPTPNTVTVNSELNWVPLGLILSLQPSIDTEKNEVTLSVRPTLSREVGERVNDPAVSLAIQQSGLENSEVKSEIPVVEVRELDSIMKVRSGQVVVIGGLMKDEVANADQGIPGVSEIPFLGRAFKGVDRQRQLSELVIFIRATIVSPGGYADQADRNLYEKFSNDPRPLTF